MGGRGRGPRAGLLPKDDAETQEESLYWGKVVNELKSLHTQTIKAENMASKLAQDDKQNDGRGKVIQKLMLLKPPPSCRKISNVRYRQLAAACEDTNILIALRTATEGGDRATESKRKKRKLDDTITSDAYSRTKMARSNSAAPGNPGGTPGAASGEVAYRLPKQKTTEGEWIQCIIIEITGEGIKRRYSVQDPEPDEAGGHGQIYKASASALIPIPKESSGLPLYPVGKQVLARYPETTTFYRAEVMGTKRDGTCRLKFEGEEEVGKETEVERRLVLDFGGK
ncbi:SGF29 tudor-like domain-containing protein [Peziza echinospora]|nr:SGF29 tudor-like domain-containing protein [Peziza echinospora]